MTDTSGVVPAQSITAALRDLYKTMEDGVSSISPFVLLQVLHIAFPRFAEKSEHGGFQQQVCVSRVILEERYTAAEIVVAFKLVIWVLFVLFISKS